MKEHTSIVMVGSMLVVAMALIVSPALVQSQETAPENVGTDGSSTTIDDLITTTTRDALVSTIASLSADHTHTCIVIASAGTFFGGGTPGAGGRYIFDLTRNGLAAAASARTVDFVDQLGEDDPNNRPVATNLTFFGLSGNQTFTFNARKTAAGAPSLTVTESAISVSCQLSGGI
jgi:hypothetical protein